MRLRIQGDQLEQLSRLFGAEKGADCQWLGYALNFQNGSIHDTLTKNVHQSEADIQILSVLLSHYALAKPAPKTGKLVKFTDLPGGYAYERSFQQRAVQPIALAFGENPAELLGAANVLKGTGVSFGDAAAEIPVLEGIPLVYIVWAKHEFPASASVLYDESASHYLPTEDLAIVAELTTSRLIKAQAILKNPDPTKK